MLEARQRTVYYSPRRRRHFLTLRGAAEAEADARMFRLFPSEEPERDGDYNQIIWPGFCFRDVPRLVAVRDRLVKRYMAAIKNGETTK